MCAPPVAPAAAGPCRLQAAGQPVLGAMATSHLTPVERYQGVQKESTGYKLLASMGWKEGQGLGVQGQGIKEHIRVKKKFENWGVGAVGAGRLLEEGGVVQRVFAMPAAGRGRHGAAHVRHATPRLGGWGVLSARPCLGTRLQALPETSAPPRVELSEGAPPPRGALPPPLPLPS